MIRNLTRTFFSPRTAIENPISSMPVRLSFDNSIFFQYGAVKYTAWLTSYVRHRDAVLCKTHCRQGGVLEKPRANGPVAVLSTGNRDSIDAEWLHCQFNPDNDDVLHRLVRVHLSSIIQVYYYTNYLQS